MLTVLSLLLVAAQERSPMGIGLEEVPRRAAALPLTLSVTIPTRLAPFSAS
jgi:hypothetical protein